MKVNNIALVFVGGALGSLCRYLVGMMINYSFQLHSSLIFIPTLFVNLAGCFIIGMLTGKTDLSKKLNLLLVTGFCGGFTTFSTFSKESLLLIQEGHLILSLIYILGSVLFGTLLLWCGYSVTHQNKKTSQI